eukprot:3136314-Amphidinium_carterae.3
MKPAPSNGLNRKFQCFGASAAERVVFSLEVCSTYSTHRRSQTQTPNWIILRHTPWVTAASVRQALTSRSTPSTCSSSSIAVWKP